MFFSKKKIKLALICTIFVFMQPILLAKLTNKEIVDIFEYSNKTKQNFIKKELSSINEFLEKPETVSLLFERAKLNKLREDKWSPEQVKDNLAWHTEVFNLIESQNINNYNGSSLKGRNFILSSELFPSYLIKIPRHHLSQNDSEPFYRQNISRILYNKLINNLIEQHQLKHIYPLKKCLIHIPTQPKTLSDQNYAVVVEKIDSIYKFSERTHVFHELLSQVMEGNLEALELIAEMAFIINKVGLWDIDPRNILFVEKYKIVFVDTEKWWYEESDQNFFHADAVEIENLRSHGISHLSKMLYKSSIDTEQQTDLLAKKLATLRKNESLTENLKQILSEL